MEVMQGELDFDVCAERTFLGWDRPMLGVLGDWLLERREALVGMLLVVPTSQSGRRVRQWLAESGGVLSPEVVTPAFFGDRGGVGADVAELNAWAAALMDMDLRELGSLFPRDPADGESFAWALSMARQFVGLKRTLEESCLSLDEVGRRSPEGDRWADLVKVERRAGRFLESWGMGNLKRGFELGAGVKRVVVAGVADLSERVRRILKGLIEAGVEVEILVYAPEFMRGRFDAWGCVLENVWGSETIPFRDWERDVAVVEEPEDAARWVVGDLAASGKSDVGLGLCDRELGGQVERVFAESGWALYDPEGSSVESSSLVQFLGCLKEWLQHWRPLEAVGGMLRLPEGDALVGEGQKRLNLVRDLDQFLVGSMVEGGNEAVKKLKDGELETFLVELLDLTKALEKDGGARDLRVWVARVIGRGDDEVAKVLLDPLGSVFDVLERLEKKRGKVGLGQLLDLVLEGVSGQMVYGDARGTVLNMEGWMELMYDGAPDVYLIGLHEGCVPERLPENSFLPESFKQLLGIPGEGFRYARDSYLMHALLAGRESVKVVLTKVNDGGEPKKPSRLLLRSEGEDLAKRVVRLFGEAENGGANPVLWERDWTLDLAKRDNPYAVDAEEVRSLSPSALRDYLACPMRFYLRRVLKMERYEAGKRELNAMDFGNLVHEVVEYFGRDEEMRESDSGEEIAKYFDKLLDEAVIRFYGFEPNLAIRIQVESARERLRALAWKQAEHRREGWRIEHVEFKVGRAKDGEEPVVWKVGGHPISMLVDRVDRLDGTERIRVLDYKTSASAKAPVYAHLTSWKAGENRPQAGELLNMKLGGKGRAAERRWSNLQLPLYAWFAQEHFGGESLPEIGYVNLPKAVTETSISVWEDFDEELMESAKEWASGTVGMIEAGEFSKVAVLPSGEKSWDEFGLMAMDGLDVAFGL